jgi:hypothetical protein
MFNLIADRLTRFARLLPAAQPQVEERGDSELAQHGWHESSWTLAQGADVIELPAPLAASWFPDTQPAFHDASEESPLAA